MTDGPLVSVLMPVYNGARYLRESTDAIFAQTLADFEVIVVDDASTDATAQILESRTDPRVRVLRNHSNQGIAKCLNRAISAAKGKYLARQDSDDVSCPRRLELQARYLDAHPEIALVGSWGFYISEDGGIRSPYNHSGDELGVRWELLFTCPMIHSSVMIRHEVAVAEGGYSEEDRFSRNEDYELWSRVAARHRITNLPHALVKYRVHGDAVSCAHWPELQEQRKRISLVNLSRLLGPSYGPEASRLLRDFISSDPRSTRPFSLAEVRLAADALRTLKANFYRGLAFADAATVRKHKRRIGYVWAKHALALAFKPASGCARSARFALARWAMLIAAHSLGTW